MIQDIVPVLEMTYEQAMEQMLCARRISWPPIGKKIEVVEWKPWFPELERTKAKLKEFDRLWG